MKLIDIKKLKGNEKGFTLTEVLIALVILGVISISVMFALNASSKTIVSAHEMTTAESLTRTIIEYIKRSDYDPNPEDGHPVYDSDNADYGTLLGLDGDPYYGEYTVDVDIERLDAEADGPADDDGIQKITVQIYHQDVLMLTTEAYKVNR